ncbi:MAG: Rcs stress response system protein RcsF [Litorilituus sp.]|jgi:RcsF protein|nr:Rcs stress response system protein RcsF [Litorilituus sp.]
MIFLKYTALLLILTLSACSNLYFVSTNLDKDNFHQYFSASAVKMYKHERDIAVKHQFIGPVEGQDCQEKPHHAAPDKIIARTQARQQAYLLQANGIVFTACAELTPEELSKHNRTNDARQCHAITICYGKAYVVETKKKVK